MGRAAAADVLGGWGGMVPASPDHAPPPVGRTLARSRPLPRLRAGVLRWSARPSPRPSGVWPTVSVRRDTRHERWVAKPGVRPRRPREAWVGASFSLGRGEVYVLCVVCAAPSSYWVFFSLYPCIPQHCGYLHASHARCCTVKHCAPAVPRMACTRTASAREGLHLTAPAPWVPPARLYLYHWYGEGLTPWVRV